MEFLDIQVTIGCIFTLKRIQDLIRTYGQMNHTDKYSQHIWIIWPVWLNSWVILYKLSGSGFESWCILHTRYCASFEQGGPWHSGNYRQYIHSDTHMWNDKNKLSVNSITVSFEKISILISQIFIIIFSSFQ